jgi:hypothetical protein
MLEHEYDGHNLFTESLRAMCEALNAYRSLLDRILYCLAFDWIDQAMKSHFRYPTDGFHSWTQETPGNVQSQHTKDSMTAGPLATVSHARPLLSKSAARLLPPFRCAGRLLYISLLSYPLEDHRTIGRPRWNRIPPGHHCPICQTANYSARVSTDHPPCSGSPEPPSTPI